MSDKQKIVFVLKKAGIKFNVHLGSEIGDETDIVEIYNSGKFGKHGGKGLVSQWMFDRAGALLGIANTD